MAEVTTDTPFEPFTLGRYQVVDILGVGGMGAVHLAEVHGVAGFTKRVVIKLIHPTHATNAAFRAMFVDEAKVMLSLKHPNVVEVLELQESGTQLYMAMEHVDGLDLHRVLKLLHATDDHLPVHLAAYVGGSFLGGLVHAHAALGPDGKPLNLIHRDVTPGNVLLSRKGEVKLTDFGVVRAEGRTTKTMSGEIKGKLRYMAPEVIHADELDARCDVFSAGVVTWEMLTGHRLFTGKTDFHVMEAVLRAPIPPPSRVVKTIPAELDAVVLKALERDRAKRWESARAFRKALLGAVKDMDAEEAQEELGHLVSRLKDSPPPPRKPAPAPADAPPPPAVEEDVDMGDDPQPVTAPVARASDEPRTSTEPSLPALVTPYVEPPPSLTLERAVSSARLPRLADTAPFAPAPVALGPVAMSGPAPAAAAAPVAPVAAPTVPGRLPRQPTPTGPRVPVLVRSTNMGEAIHVHPQGEAVVPATAESALAYLCSSVQPPPCRVGVRADALLDLDTVGRAWLLDHLQTAPWLTLPASAGRVSDFGIGKMLLAAAQNAFTGAMVLEPAPGAQPACAFVVNGQLAYTFKRDPREHLLALFIQHAPDSQKLLARVLRLALGGMPMPRAITSSSSLSEMQVANALEMLSRQRLVDAIRAPAARFFLLPGMAPPPGLPTTQLPLVSLIPQIYFTASSAEVKARVDQLLAKRFMFQPPSDPTLLQQMGVAAEAAILADAMDYPEPLRELWPNMAPPGSEREQSLSRALILLEQCGFLF